MAPMENKNLKTYYSIKEVANMFNVAESLLRYWEKEFPQISPKTAGNKNIRQYTEKDIEIIRTIYNLVKVRGFKLAAALTVISLEKLTTDKINAKTKINNFFIISPLCH